MCAIKLNFPQQQGNQSRGDTHLPQMNLSNELEPLEAYETGHKMLDTLRQYNRASLDSLKRYQLMLKVKSPLGQLIKHLEQHYLSTQRKADGPSDLAAIELSRQLLNETACGFTIIANELTKGELDKPAKELLCHTITHALHYQSHYLMEHYLTYQPISSDIWNEIKRLYQIAQRYQIEKEPLYDKEGMTQNIEETFIILLLFAAINPFRLKRSEIVTSYQIITHWAHLCQLENCDDNWQPNNEWVIDTTSEKPPEFLQQDYVVKDHRTLLRINTARVEEAQQNDELETLSLEGTTELKQTLLERLRQGWASAPPRHYERRSSFQDAELVAGFNRCHQQLIDQEMDKAGQDTPGSLWSFHLANRWLEGEVEAQEPVCHQLQQVDVSIGGYGLRCDRNTGKLIQKMDLALIRHPSVSNEAWRVGQIRWKMETPGDEIMMGVCLLAEDAAPLIIINAAPGMDEGLLLPCCDFENPAATLLLPSGYQKGNTLQCITANEQVRIELLEEQAHGPDFKQFSYHLLRDK